MGFRIPMKVEFIIAALGVVGGCGENALIFFWRAKGVRV
jgi:hypothetical protein